MSETIEELLLKIVRDFCPAATQAVISLDTPLEATGIDSLAMAEIMFELEDTFDVKIPETNVSGADFQTLREVHDAIARSLPTRAVSTG